MRAVWSVIFAAAALAVFVAAALAASTDFVQPATSPEIVGDLPYQVAAGDLDGDGDADLAVVNYGSGNVTILKNNGGGNFFEPATSPEDVGDGPTGIVAVDLDGDADRDLAVANFTSNNVTILKNNGGGNFFEPATSPETGPTDPFAVSAADLDGDADADLALANFDDDNVTILKNNGGANFNEPSSSPEPAGNGPAGVSAADLDGDADADLAVANFNGTDVTILKNNGGGNFNQPASSPEAAGGNPGSVVAGDLDGDGDADLAVANQGSGDVTILRNNGGGNFVEPASSPEPAGGFPISVVAADFDGDADRDLAVANFGDSTVTILRNTGGGNFVVPATSPETTGTGPALPAAADFDGDADPDLAIPNYSGSPGSVTILRNR